MRVRLTDVGGYLHDHEGLPSEVDLYFGAARGPMFGGEGPRIDEDGIEWPNPERRLEKGMVVGSMVSYQAVIDRWSPLPGSVRAVLMEVHPEKGLLFQERAKTMEGLCGGQPPFAQLTGWSADELQGALDDRDANSELYAPVEGRLPINQTEAEDEIHLPTQWLGSCLTEEWFESREQEPEPECESDSDCEHTELGFLIGDFGVLHR